MHIILDECISDAVAACLGERTSHEVVRIADIMPRAKDEAVLAIATASASLLITNDKDFGELVSRSKLESPGVLLCRLGSLSVAAEAELVLRH